MSEHSRAFASSSMPVDWTQPMVRRRGGTARGEKSGGGVGAAKSLSGGGEGRGRGGARSQPAAHPLTQAPASPGHRLINSFPAAAVPGVPARLVPLWLNHSSVQQR